MPSVSITRAARFNAAHRLHSVALSDEENRCIFGKCNNPWGHGHDYRLEVTVRGEVDARTGMVMNLTDLKQAINERVIAELDHKHLDHDVPWLTGINTTVENLVVACWQRLHDALGSLLFEVKLHETPNNWAIYRGE